MNTITYSQLYAIYHGAYSFDLRNDKYIQIRIFAQYDLNEAVLKLTKLKHVDYTTPTTKKSLVRGLQTLLNVQSTVTSFYDDHTWALLFGNSVLLYPMTEGLITLTATPYFVENVKVFRERMQETYRALQTFDLIYRLGVDVVLYLDAEDTIYPGSRYFGSDRGSEDSMHRICFLTRDPSVPIPEHVLQDRRLCREIPLRLRTVQTCISPFLPELPFSSQSDGRLPISSNYDATNVVVQRRSRQKPAYVVQDILESYANGAPVVGLGLLIEAPLCIGFPGHDPRTVSLPREQKQFYALAVNCVEPRKLLYVPSPYDRYFEHREAVPRLKWTTVYYDDQNNLSSRFLPVYWDNTVLGLVYRDTFFCFSHPMLGNQLSVRFRRVDQMDKRLSFRLDQDPDMLVVDSFRYFGGGPTTTTTVLHHVKHKDMPFEMWCLGPEGDDNDTKFITTRGPNLTNLVGSWLSLLNETSFPREAFPDATYIKILATLCRHDVCFRLEESGKKDPAFRYEKHNLTFALTPSVCKIINELRLWNKKQQCNEDTTTIKQQQAACTMM